MNLVNICTLRLSCRSMVDRTIALFWQMLSTLSSGCWLKTVSGSFLNNALNSRGPSEVFRCKNGPDLCYVTQIKYYLRDPKKHPNQKSIQVHMDSLTWFCLSIKADMWPHCYTITLCQHANTDEHNTAVLTQGMALYRGIKGILKKYGVNQCLALLLEATECCL